MNVPCRPLPLICHIRFVVPVCPLTNARVPRYHAVPISTTLSPPRAHSPGLTPRECQCYELRLHEDDGYPDTDMPALDRSRKVKHFSTGGVHEYCLCRIPSVKPDVMTDKRRLEKINKVKGGGAAAGGGGNAGFIKIFMKLDRRGGSNSAYILALNGKGAKGGAGGGGGARMCMMDLLPLLEKKAKVHLPAAQLEFRLQQDDRKELKHTNGILNMTDDIRRLNIEAVDLCSKKYADAPRRPQPPKDLGQTESKNVNKSSFLMKASEADPNSFGFNMVTGANYQQWEVIKTNKFNRKQHRIMGVDLQTIYNMKVAKDKFGNRMRHKARAGPANTHRPERRVLDIIRCDFREDTTTGFYLVFREDSGSSITVEYDALNARDAAEIVAKVKYLMDHHRMYTADARRG